MDPVFWSRISTPVLLLAKEKLLLSVLRQLLPLFIVRKLEQLFALGSAKSFWSCHSRQFKFTLQLSLAVMNVLTSGMSSPRGLFFSLSSVEPIR